MRSDSLTPLKVVRSGLCIGCGSCAAQAGKGMRFDKYGQLRPEDGVKGESLAETCPFSPNALNEDELAANLFPSAPRYDTVGRYLSAYVGYVEEPGFRYRGSSGGMVSWVLAELMRKGLIDGAIHVTQTDPESGRYFDYRISRTTEEIFQGAKSRYYPVEMSQVLRQITEQEGRYAIVGVPCFIKAVQLLRRKDSLIAERIAYTLGLFCGHMKSAQFVESFALQMGAPLDQVQAVDYRIKDVTRPASTYTAELTLKDGSTRRRDWWNLVDGDWGSGFWQYEACNYCDDVIAETADISFGDAWVEPYSSDGRGTNVVVIRSPEVDALVRQAIEEDRLCLKPVDEEFIVATQAAGFRQRREGLAYRLTWSKKGIQPVKRVSPSREETPRRKLMYRMRAHITTWSHRIMVWSPKLFLKWGKVTLGAYQGLAYSRGSWGRLFKKLK